MYNPTDHAFAVAAYGECPYLEECIQSLKAQTLKTNIYISTSTPNDLIDYCSKKYNLPVYVNPGSETCVSNWNFAIYCSDYKLVTLVHQDDVYKKDYAEKMLRYINKSKQPLIFFSGYSELRDKLEVDSNLLINVKKFLLLPILFSKKSVFARRLSLSFGCAICCPSVTYAKDNINGLKFLETAGYDLDWDAWERLSKLSGDFVYCKDSLMLHRIHEGSGNLKAIREHARKKDDLLMFQRFWPNRIANILLKIYSVSEKSNIV